MYMTSQRNDTDERLMRRFEELGIGAMLARNAVLKCVVHIYFWKKDSTWRKHKTSEKKKINTRGKECLRENDFR